MDSPDSTSCGEGRGHRDDDSSKDEGEHQNQKEAAAALCVDLEVVLHFGHAVRASHVRDQDGMMLPAMHCLLFLPVAVAVSSATAPRVFGEERAIGPEAPAGANELAVVDLTLERRVRRSGHWHRTLPVGSRHHFRLWHLLHLGLHFLHLNVSPHRRGSILGSIGRTHGKSLGDFSVNTAAFLLRSHSILKL